MRLPALLVAATLLGTPAVAGAAEGGEPGSPRVFDRIAAVVNNEVITLSDIDRELPPGARVPPGERERLRRQALDRLIEAALVAQEAQRANVSVTPAEIEAEIAAVRDREKLSEAELAAALEAEGLSIEEYRQRLGDNLRRAKVIAREVRSSLTIPEARLKAYYDEHAAEFTPPAAVRVRLLLVPLEPGATEAERAAARADAQALRVRAVSGEAFEALVRERSKGPAASEGGDLGTMQAGQLDPRFEAALRPLAPGQISAPVVVEGGVALLQLVERTGGQPAPFATVRDRIFRTLYEREFEQALKQWVERLRARAAIEVRI
jgi:peptidyl-prolyl cis-trans isomerase SurA